VPNPRGAGRPRGKGPGKYTVTPATVRANHAKSLLPRPGRRENTPEEKVRAYAAEAIGRSLVLEVTEQISHYLKANLLALKRFNEVIADPWSTAEKIDAMRAARMQPHELKAMFDAIHNRWGTPPRTVVEVDAANRIPPLFEVPLAGWAFREDAHAAADTGNGHANGHAKH